MRSHTSVRNTPSIRLQTKPMYLPLFAAAVAGVVALFLFDSLTGIWLASLGCFACYLTLFSVIHKWRFSMAYIWGIAIFFFLHAEVMWLNARGTQPTTFFALRYIILVNWLVLVFYTAFSALAPIQSKQVASKRFRGTGFTFIFLLAFYSLFWMGVLLRHSNSFAARQMFFIMLYAGQALPAFLVYYFGILKQKKMPAVGILLAIPILVFFF